jgi:protein ImuB
VDDPAEVRFEATLELEWPIEGLEPLSFGLARLLEPLCAVLQHEERGAATVRTRLDLVTRTSHVRLLQLPAPMNDPKVLRTLILLDLEAHPPDAGIDRITVLLDPIPGRRVQFSLFHRPLPAPDQIATLVARLGALMGEGRCGSPVLLDTHRPGAFALAPFAPQEPAPERRRGGATRRAGRLAPGPPASALPASVAESAARRAQPEAAPWHPGGDSRGAGQPCAVLRRFRRPVPVRVAVREGRPARVHADGAGLPGGAVAECAGPWRTSGAWWQVSPAATSGPWARDEWDLAIREGPVYRVSRAPAPAPGGGAREPGARDAAVHGRAPDAASVDRWVIEGIWD